MSSSFPILARGTLLNRRRYRIVKLIHEGGMGRLYKGWHIDLNLPIAIKENIRGDAAQFKLEAQILMMLNHPNLPHGLDFFQDSELFYLAMDLVEGNNLAELCANGGLPETTVIPWFNDVLNAVEHLHKLNVIHRDIKPENIIIVARTKAVLTDFGIAKFKNAGQSTLLGAKGFGTPPYAPPEQHAGATTDERSDIHALGKTLEFILTGQNGRAPGLPLYPHYANVPPNTDAVIHKATQRDPLLRYANVKEMRDELLKWKQTTVLAPPTQPTQTPTQPTRHASQQNWLPYILASAGGITLVILAILFILIPRNGNSNPALVASVIATPSASPNVVPGNTSTPTLTRTFSMTPSPSATRPRTFTLTPTVPPTRTRTFTPTLLPPTFTITPKPFVDGEFANLWNRYSNQLGAPKPGYRSAKSFSTGTFAEQRFERGHMFFVRVPTKRILVVVGSRSGAWTGQGDWWQQYPDTFVDGVNDKTTCRLGGDIPRQPVGGFGLLWCNNRTVRDALGYGVTREVDIDSQSGGNRVYLLQEFQNGVIFRDSDGWSNCNRGNCLAYVFFNDGTFRRESY